MQIKEAKDEFLYDHYIVKGVHEHDKCKTYTKADEGKNKNM